MIHYTDERVTLHHGDCLDVLRQLPANSVDAVVCDPPYSISFMGRGWDAHATPGEFQHWCEQWAAECLRVLKPGGFMLAFGGTRTYHRLTSGIEDAGFEIRDSVIWNYASGFPKSLNVGLALMKAAGLDPLVDEWTPEALAYKGHGTSLKPAFEPIVVARKPLAAPGVNVLHAVESELRNRGVVGEISWSPNASVRNVAPSTPSPTLSATPAPETVTALADPAGANVTRSSEQPTANDSAQTTRRGEKPTASTSGYTAGAKTPNCETPSSLPMDRAVFAAESPSANSLPSTTSTAVEAPTEKQSMARSTPNFAETASPLATESFAGIATGLTGSRATVLINRLEDGSFVWPDGLPRYVSGGPTTVAANVTAWGTGALNIGATRVGTDSTRRLKKGGANDFPHEDDAWKPRDVWAGSDQGRWPTNVVLTHSVSCGAVDQPGPCVEGCPVRELDAQSGVQKDGVAVQRNRNPELLASDAGWGLKKQTDDVTYGGSGGASRYFPTFRYEAKAPTSERPRVTTQGGDLGVSLETAHPT